MASRSKRYPILESLDGRTPVGSKRRQERLLRFITSGMLLTIMLVVPELCFEQWTSAGREFTLVAYNLTQKHLSSSVEASLPVTVVDISDLQPQQIPGIDAPVTPRDALQKLLETIADDSPNAIGVDIDFSPDDRGWIDPLHDPQFFRFCLNLKTTKNVPVFLGVHRSQSMSPAEWLGDGAFKSLAAAIAVPNDTRKMLRSLSVGPTEPLNSMAFQLARNSIKGAPWWVDVGGGWAIDELGQKKLAQGTVRADEFFVDFSGRNLIEKTKIDYQQMARDGAARLKDRFYRKVVIVGTAQLDKASNGDVFAVVKSAKEEENAESEARFTMVPGAIVHACAAYTLMETAPLYGLTLLGNLLADVLLSLAVFLLVGCTWYFFPGKTVAIHRLQLFFTFVIAALAFILGVLCVRTTRILWDGFIIVLLVLCLHPSFERFVKWLPEAFRGHLVIERPHGRTH